MALSLLCGGLGVASAADGTVHVAESAAGTAEVYEVYTTEKVDTLLDGKADKTALDSKANETEVTKNTGNIATNTANINTLRSELGNKADESTVTTALGGKANTSLNNLDEAGKSVIKTMMADELAKKADKSYVDNAVAGAVTTAGTNVNEKLKDYAKTTYVDTEVGKKANKATTLAGYEITDAYTKEEVYNKGEVARKLDKKADLTALDQATGKINDQQTAIDDLKKKTTQISYADGDGTTISGVRITDGNIVGNGNSAITQLANVETDKIKTDRINGKSLTGTTVATEKEVKDVADAVKTETDERKAADTALEEKITKNTQDIATLDGKVTTAEGNITDLKKKDTELEGRIKNNEGNIETNKNAISDIKQRTAGIDRIDATNETTIEGNVTVDNHGNVKAKGGVTADGKLKGAGVDAGDGAITTTGAVNAGSLNVENASTLKGDVTMNQKLSVTGDTSLGKTDVDGALTVTGESSLKNTTVGGKLTAKENATFEKNVTVEKDLTVNGKLNVDKISMKNEELKNGKKHDSATTITADEISNLAKVTDEKGNTTESQFTHNEKGTFNYAKDEKITGEWKGATSNVTADGVSNKMTDSAGNTHTYYQTAAETKEQLVNGNKSNFEKKTAEGNTISIKDKDADGNKKSLTNKQTVDGEKTSVTNKDSSSTVNQGADQIRNYVASTDGTKSSTEVKADGITNTSDGTITNDANHIENKANTMDTTVTGKATESYGELETTVNGNETHTVTGTKTENVTGKVTENYKAGQATNVTGDQDINVSGTQTTTATDIKRNASSGMIDTIDNDYGTNTETKVAGKTTTDVSIKGTGEKGQYIRGANESRDYLIKGTLKNSETKTAEATSTEITDGTNKASTIQDAKNLAGSVTNGKETGVSGIHANNDGSVSIDSSVAGGGMSSVINQKKDSIQSAVGDGTNSTVIHQDKDNVTIASSNGMVGLVGKDIVNNAKDTITNTAGTKITDTAGDSTVTTENGKGTTFTKTGSTAYREGGPTDTNISGNTITTGKVTMDYAQVMRDLGVNGNANIDGKTTTGLLEVKGESKLTGDVTMESNATVKKDLTVEGNTNLKNTKVDGTLDVTQKATFGDSVSIAKDLSVDGNATIKGDVTAKSYKVGDKTYISAAGINANDQKITNVADGSISEGSKDAVNGGQLYTVKNDLEGKVNKVGANAAAMANLHPMEFDPSSKWNIAAAIGNYGSETAAAIGAFYRPNDNVMVNLSTAFGTGENMVGGGVSVRLGKGGNKLSREETNALKAQVADLTARMDALLSVLNPNMSKDFPDVPENHWAYEAVSRLAGNDIVQGYPDGEFHGERTMTRYEMAEIIYNALSRGAEAEKELVEEFKPELQAMAASEKATAERAEG